MGFFVAVRLKSKPSCMRYLLAHMEPTLILSEINQHLFLKFGDCSV